MGANRMAFGKYYEVRFTLCLSNRTSCENTQGHGSWYGGIKERTVLNF